MKSKNKPRNEKEHTENSMKFLASMPDGEEWYQMCLEVIDDER